ncbi:MAG: alpha-2-macroglobulin family protein [Terrimicrobiaceae bacterium]|nr:alpha-2-macroglobulin family protein [Terrimicrobiaceae bacterium]
MKGPFLRAAFLLGLWLGAATGGLSQPAGSYAELRQRAAEYYSEQSYALAHQAWSEAAKLDVPAGERSTLDFYLADSLWRSQPDAEQVAGARAALEKIAGGPDALAAEASESLGDSWLAIGSDWDRAWKEYERALKFWAAATDLDPARERYLGIVWKATGPPSANGRDRRVPVDVLSNALRIAPDAEARARAHFFLGRWHLAEGDPFSSRRAGREFQAAIDEGPDTAVYEAALFELAQWSLSAGSAQWREGGQLALMPDYERALELFRRFVREFPKGRSQYTDRASAQIDDITRPSLSIAVDNQFLPGVKPAIRAQWRNVGAVRFSIRRVDLARDFRPTSRTAPETWLDAVQPPEGEAVRQWTDPDTLGAPYAPRDKILDLEAIDEAGTYQVEASGGGLTSRALLVVTSGAAIVQPIGGQVVAFLCDARTGARAAEATARLWRARSMNDQWRWQAVDGPPAKDGLITFDLPKAKAGENGRLFLFGRAGDQPFVAQGYAANDNAAAKAWRIEVFTDRAAYRPGDTVRWKLIARKRAAGSYATPAGALVKFTVTDPRGAKVDEGEVKLTEFGGAWGELALRTDLALGEYGIEFRRGDESLGGGTLFRLEEYRLPEFKVGVVAAGDAKAGIRLGDEFEAKISAEYYFGGAVADAKVAVEVREEPYARPLPWPEPGFRSIPPPAGGEARIVKNETVRTGPDGTAAIRVRTPPDGRTDLRYTITARVVDSSGREVVATGSLVVGRQGYFVEMRPSRRVALPKDAVEISFEARDGNGRRLAAPGSLTVTRQRWTEVWLDPQGREVTGAVLDKLKHGVFPPPGEAGWRLIRQEYTGDEVARDNVATNADGRGVYTFRPGSAGFYRIAWSSADGDGPPVTAETNVWVSDSAAGMIGYRSGGVEIIVDPAAPARGGKAPVLITTDTSDRDVLLLVHAGGDLFRAEVVHLDGDSKLVELESEARFVPNVFVTAGAVRGLEFFADTKEIKFPPYRNALSAEIRPASTTSLPGAEAAFRLAVKDAAGDPVRGEFALGVSDEAISYIQEDYAGNPVDFFFGQQRAAGGDPTSSMSRSPFFVKRDPVTRSEFSERGDLLASPQAAVAAAMAPRTSGTRQAGGEAAIAVRSNFSATAFWQPGIVTDSDGVATVKFKYPDSLTTWRAVLRGATAGAEFGFAETTTRTAKPLIARLQAPRFLVAGDQVEISGVVNNRTSAQITAHADLRVEGLAGSPRTQSLRIEPDGDARASWRLGAPEPGTAKLTLTAASGSANDGIAAVLPICDDGIDKSVSISGKAVAADATWKLTLPAERRRGSETLVVAATPSLAAAALDALPYLIRYPYGCVEQTMSRFLPAAVTARTLQSLGLDRGAVANRIFGGIEPEFLVQTHPKTAGDAGLGELDAAIARGMARLADSQHGDGAWGWWKGDASDAFMTAYVVWGLRLAQQAGVAVRSDRLDHANAWLRLHLIDARDEPNLQAWLLHALAIQHEAGGSIASEERAALDNLWNRRDQLTAYGRALFALAAHGFGDSAKARTLVRNLRDGVIRDAQPDVSSATAGGQANPTAQNTNAAIVPTAQNTNAAIVPTAHWGSEGMFRAWQDGGVEATAFALQALLAIEPQSDLIEPAMNWLVKNRRGAQWSNTRDTAITVLAINRYLAATKDLGKAASFRIEVNGKLAAEVRNATALDGQSRFEIDRSLLRDGENEIALRRSDGDGPIYLSAQAKFFTLEHPIPAAGSELFVKREYFRQASQLTLLDGYRFDRVPWKEGESAPTDQRVTVVLTLDAKNDLDYVLVEDLKPAGLEAVDVRSGGLVDAEGMNGERLPVYCELRDRKVALFIRKLPQGTWAIRYDLRTETAGEFSALPVCGQAMYAPEIRCNGESRRVTIGEGR